jgi:DNA replication terminus site-binding protein
MNKIEIDEEFYLCWSKLRANLLDLQHKILHSSPSACFYYSLPPMMARFENHVIEQIKCTTYSNKKALFLCSSSLGKFYIMPEWSSKMAQRYPGVVQISLSQLSELENKIIECNVAKKELLELLSKLPNQRMKRATMDKLMNNSSTKAIVRHIVQIADNKNKITKVTFHWNHRPNVRKITRLAVISQLEDMKGKTQGGIEKKIWHRKIDISINKIMSLPMGTSLRIKRPTKAQPMVNVHSDETGWMQYSASLPLIIFSDADISYEHLHSYDSQLRRSIRSDSILSDEPIIDELPVFAVKTNKEE